MLDDDDDGATRYHTSEGFTWEKEYERSWDDIKEDERGLRIEVDNKIRKRRYATISLSLLNLSFKPLFINSSLDSIHPQQIVGANKKLMLSQFAEEWIGICLSSWISLNPWLIWISLTSSSSLVLSFLCPPSPPLPSLLSPLVPFIWSVTAPHLHSPLLSPLSKSLFMPW